MAGPFPQSTIDTLGDVAEIIQVVVAPVFLLTGIGSFLNVCALRMARIVDRARAIEPELLASSGEKHQRLLNDLRVLDRRIATMNWAIFFTVLSAVLICTVVFLLFADQFIDSPLAAVIAILFMGSVVAIGLGFFIFLIETRIASRAVRIRTELLEHEPAGPTP